MTWNADFGLQEVAAYNGAIMGFAVTRERGELLRRIPDMLTEIQRLRDENSNLEASCMMESRENERLRALNAEMREALARTTKRLERCMIAFGNDKEYIDAALEEPRAILAKTEESNAPK